MDIGTWNLWKYATHIYITYLPPPVVLCHCKFCLPKVPILVWKLSIVAFPLFGSRTIKMILSYEEKINRRLGWVSFKNHIFKMCGTSSLKIVCSYYCFSKMIGWGEKWKSLPWRYVSKMLKNFSKGSATKL